MLKKLLLLLVGMFVVFGGLIQLIPYGRNHVNSPVLAEPNWDSQTTRTLFFKACGDCHSNETKWPWYSNIAPVSWLVQRDVDEGRSKFNVSVWGHQEENEGDEAAELVKTGEMPLPIYLVMHPEARLNDQEISTLIQGLVTTFGGEMGGEGGGGEEGDGD